MKIVALIAAAGKGKRMNTRISKPFILISGKPILAYTLEKFEKCKLIDKIYLVFSPEEKEICHKNIILKYNFSKVQELVDGGETRQDSIYNGLKALDKDCLLYTSDAADEEDSVDLGGRRIIKKKKIQKIKDTSNSTF